MDFLKTLNEEEKALVTRLQLQHHIEGGWFKEVYASSITNEERRAIGGSIYFLLSKEERSHFHTIDCDELWYFHQGCGVNVWFLLSDGKAEKRVLDENNPFLIIPKGSVFAAENMASGYTLMSCATIPMFRYEGFKLFKKDELLSRYPLHADLIERLCIE